MNPTKRIKQLQTGCPYPIELLVWVPGGQEREREFHRRFAAFRVRGEWFDASPNLVAFVADLKAGRGQ